ncbi:ornithine carbamoyltransferase [Streptomyces sp. NPDC048248]|uniref:ornithine carbamoyltransferase n=1 Tax=Streptomyces sp. NPDC048248 TaxID=3365523 RepID=UPI00371B5BC1
MNAGFPNRRPLLSLADLSTEDITDIGEIAFRYGQTPESFRGRMAGTRVGLVFTVPSTRTRTSFWSAALTLGCDILHLGQADLQVSTGETWSDTGAMLANYLDVVVARTNGPQRDLAELAVHVPATIDALTYEEHPTQAIADLCAMREHFGDVEDLRLAYLGEVNNTVRALALLVCKLPFRSLDVYSPDGSGFSAKEIDSLNAIRGARVVRQHHEVPTAPDPVDVVYTTRWQSMSAARHDQDWLSRFAGFSVTKDLMRRFSGSVEAVFMHDLPAVRDQEVTSDVLDGNSVTSLVQRQAYHKASAAAAALLWTAGAPS